ncbi:MAG TPA: hypothetical protein VFA12_09150 [Stellaceae bacterium]|nr:hypothetical protein [Stellaceae bacterium]
MRFSRCLGVAALALSACTARLTSGPETILISTNPPGASCKVERQGARLADLPATPGVVVVPRTSFDVLVTCWKPGYQTVTLFEPPQLLRPKTGNVVVNHAFGAATEAATGGIYRYPNEVALDLIPRSAGGIAVPY